MVKLVEIDIGEFLRSVVADDESATFGLVEKGFVSGKVVPVAFATADGDAFGWAVENHFVPQILKRAIKFATVRKLAF